MAREQFIRILNGSRFMSKYMVNDIRYVSLTISIVSDLSNWGQILKETIPAMEEELMKRYGVQELFLGHEMSDPHQLYLFLYAPSSRKFIVARFIDKYLKKYLSRANLPKVAYNRIEVSLWMPYEENTIKYGLFFIAEKSNKLKVGIYSSINKINRTLMLDPSFGYDMLLIRAFCIIYMTTVCFEEFAEELTGEELIYKLYRLDTEPFEDLYEKEEELFKWVAEQIDCSDLSELEWLIHWKTFLDSYALELPQGLSSSELKKRYAEILNTFFTINRLPLTERISLMVATRNVMRDKKSALSYL